MKSNDTHKVKYINETVVIDNVTNDYYNDHIKFIYSKEYSQHVRSSCIEYAGRVHLYKILKSGNVSKKCDYLGGMPYVPLRVCELCSLISTPKRIQYRGGLVYWDMNGRKEWWKSKKNGVLCMSCWNKLRPVIKKEMDVYLNRDQINKINRELTKYVKQINENNG